MTYEKQSNLGRNGRISGGSLTIKQLDDYIERAGRMAERDAQVYIRRSKQVAERDVQMYIEYFINKKALRRVAEEMGVSHTLVRQSIRKLIGSIEE